MLSKLGPRRLTSSDETRATIEAGARIVYNPLKNPSFDQGAYDRDGLNVPKDWVIWFADEKTPLLPGQDQPFSKPQAVVWSIAEAPAWEADAFLSGDFCWRVWGAWRPLWVALRQKVTGLTPNVAYRFTVSVHPDLVMDEQGGGKQYADHPLAGEHRLTATFGGATAETGWRDGRDVPFGQYSRLSLDFTPTTSEATVSVEFRCRWGLAHNGWFVDSVGIERLPAGASPLEPKTISPQPRPAATPAPAAVAPLPMPPLVALSPIPIKNRLFDYSLAGWETWANVRPGDCAYQMPAFEAYASPVPPLRVMAGHTALRISIGAGKSYEACVRQTVTGLQPGTPLRFNAHGHAWASTGDNPDKSEGAGTASMRIGIDPHGGTDPNAGSVTWSPFADPWDRYQLFQVETVAMADSVTLFLYAHPSLCLKHDETFWDNAVLWSTGPAISPAAPSPRRPAPRSRQSQPGPPEPAPHGGRPIGPNLLRNGDFNQGYYHLAPELAVPNEWEFWHADERVPKLERQSVPFLKPDSVVWNIQDAPESEKRAFFLSGAFCWRVFGAWNPMWVALKQRVAGLTPGATYRFTVPFYPDLVTSYGQDGTIASNRFAPDPLSGEHRLSATFGSATVDTGWKDGRDVPFGKYTRVSLDFIPATAEATVALEFRGRWGLVNNGWLVDSAELKRLG